MIHALLFVPILFASQSPFLRCSDAQKIASRIWSNDSLTQTQRVEIISTIQETVPECPLTNKENNK